MISRVLILSDGSLPALIACAQAYEELCTIDADLAKTITPYILAHELHGRLSSSQIEAVRRQARAYSLLDVEKAEPPAAHLREGASDAERETLALVSATFQAAALGCTRVVWPVLATNAANDAPGLDVDRMTRVFDLARVVSRIVTMQADAAVVSGDGGVAGVEVSVPFADLTDDQLADLALDMSVPIEMCWWWGGKGEASREHARWTRALASMGWQRSGSAR